ncbi:alpha/beta hydrolase [Reticulibacter mediterranei]|uniref:alpha/beta hydrolase n=1 Tax=Reticulibacter mediterranei TaxID=2778369 RepID=UPI001C68AFB8|nr:alpha/beta fold hydrolase [Reticulibacter mediterranei]
MKRLLPFFSAFFLYLFLLPLSSTYTYADSTTSCTQSFVPVTLSSLDPTIYHVATWLCSQGPIEGKTVQVLVHGSTYDHTYWDFPSLTETNSYVRRITSAGYAVLSLDRIGTGLSDHPPALQVTLLSNAYVLHQIIQQLRNGSFQGESFSKIILVGHSFGSTIAITEASSYGDADGIIITGVMHTVNATGAAAVIASFYPVNLDPKFAQSNLPSGYLTTKPETRSTSFYNTADTNTSIIAEDEQLKQTITNGELATVFVGLSPTSTLLIQVPVLVAVGEKDITVCGLALSCATNAAIVARESTFYSPHACLEGYALSSSGHSINLHNNTSRWLQAAIDWANRRIGSSSTNPPTQLCQ